MCADILAKIKSANLIGRGGAGFSVYLKWQASKQAQGSPKYVICNASEGEPLVRKDFYILQHYPEKVFLGMRLAMDFLQTKLAYLNIQAPFYQRLQPKLDNLIDLYAQQGYQISVFKEPPSYIGGEETALLNAIEGRPLQPRSKPPYPVEQGLFGKPTLVHNVETLFDIASVAQGDFAGRQFFSVIDLNHNEAILHLDQQLTVFEILQQAKALPKSDYFVHVCGGACGTILNSKQIKSQKMQGFGSIILYPASLSARELLGQWFTFYRDQSCGKCTPCREGTYQLCQLLKESDQIPWLPIMEIIETMELTSFCALGKSLANPVKSYYQNIYLASS